MIILRIIEILLGFERAWNRKRNDILIPTYSENRLRNLLLRAMDHFSFHGKAGFDHIHRMDGIPSSAFLSFFLPYRIAVNP